MAIRGKRSIWPSKPPAPTGIFSTKGKQKNDSNAHMPNQKARTYALGSSASSKPKGGNGEQGLRHQKPVKQW